MRRLAIVCAIAALGFSSCSREAAESSSASASLRVARIERESMPPRKVIFVGLDGADWELLNRYISDGTMPNLKRLVSEGASGVLTTIQPPLSPLVWTTMMTGVSPVVHQILDFTRISTTGAREPITSSDRAVPAIWNMASMAGRRVAVFGLWATWPAETVDGILVSDRLFSFQDARTRAMTNTVYPPGREAWARDALQKSLDSNGFDRISKFIPALTRDEWDTLSHDPDPYAHPETALARVLVETDVYNRLAIDSLTRDKADLTIVYFQGTDAIGHLFAPYAPPRLPEISASDYARYNEVARRYFAWIDEILGSYDAIAKKNGADLFVASDHGFEWGEARPRHFTSFAAATAAKWHRKEGIYLLAGPDVRRRSGSAGSVTQVCPTLLSLLGIPNATNAASTPLSAVERHVTAVADYRAHYKPATVVASVAGNGEEIAKLKALGYIGGDEPTRFAAGSGSRTPASYNNEGLILLNEGKPADAQRALERALAIDPHYASALWNLSDLLAREHQDEARSDELLAAALAAGLPDGPQRVIERAMAARTSGSLQRATALLDNAVAALPADPQLRLFRGRYRLEANNCSGALGDFREAERLAPRDALAPASAGLADMCLGDVNAAKASFRRSLAIDPNQPRIAEYLGQLR